MLKSASLLVTHHESLIPRLDWLSLQSSLLSHCSCCDCLQELETGVMVWEQSFPTWRSILSSSFCSSVCSSDPWASLPSVMYNSLTHSPNKRLLYLDHLTSVEDGQFKKKAAIMLQTSTLRTLRLLSSHFLSLTFWLDSFCLSLCDCFSLSLLQPSASGSNQSTMPMPVSPGGGVFSGLQHTVRPPVLLCALIFLFVCFFLSFWVCFWLLLYLFEAGARSAAVHLNKGLLCLTRWQSTI